MLRYAALSRLSDAVVCRSVQQAAQTSVARSAHTSTTNVVIAGAGGVGSALCRTLVQNGGNVVLTSTQQSKADALASELVQEVPGASVRALEADATDSSQLEQAMKVAKEQVSSSGTIDGVVNCAGSVLLKPAHTTSDDDFANALDVNAKTAFATVKAAAKQIAKAKNATGASGTSVALCSSTVALHGVPNHEAIAAAKGAVLSLTRSAASTYASSNVRFNAVAPGLTRSPITAKITENEQAAKSSMQMHAIKRLGEPSDVASALAFLLDPANSWITGVALPVDGGLSSVYTPPSA